jgi:hypothetical protein
MASKSKNYSKIKSLFPVVKNNYYNHHARPLNTSSRLMMNQALRMDLQNK